jgi:hydroxyacyl-ACP dehydratase HTD2-like protein with hotdog domain
MALPIRSIQRLTKRPIQLSPTRSYATDTPSWFPAMRTALLSRPGTLQHERISALPSEKLTTALSSFFPAPWNLSPTPTHPFLPTGHHLIWFNANLATHELLPDGTDALHSPPAPFVRRMWAGGEVRVSPAYFSRENGFTMGAVVSCMERIKDVRVSGQQAASKVFVTIERRFARAGVEEDETMIQSTTFRSQTELQEELQKGETLITEERNLVFLTERTERDTLARETAQVRYLNCTYLPLTPFSYIQACLLTS